MHLLIRCPISLPGLILVLGGLGVFEGVVVSKAIDTASCAVVFTLVVGGSSFILALSLKLMINFQLPRV